MVQNQDEFKDNIDNLERTVGGFFSHFDLKKHEDIAKIV